MKRCYRGTFLFAVLFSTFLLSNTAQGQDRTIEISPADPVLDPDEEIRLSATVLDNNGNALPDTVVFYSRDRRGLTVSPDGHVKAHQPGSYEVIALAARSGDERLRSSIEVKVNHLPLSELSFEAVPENFYAGTRLSLSVKAVDTTGSEPDELDIKYNSSNPEVAEVDDYGILHIKKPGAFRITANAQELSETLRGEASENPVREIELSAGTDEARTGDVIRLDARPLNENGEEVADIPLTYSFTAKPDDRLGEPAPAQMAEDGRFVANDPGLYTLSARAGNIISEQTIRVNERNVQKELEVVGHGEVFDVHTSDLWVWEAADGRDYAITGTWGGNGTAYFWDVTDPADITPVDTVTVDARTVNDVKISEDGTIGVITREGASDRRNGMVVLDVTDPTDVEILSEYDEGLTGGVHNVFIYEDHVYAVNNGRRYDIINIEEPRNPETVSRFELGTPGHALHDVWIEDGIAYSSNWDDGVVAVDVGSTDAADTPERHDVGVGSPENPVELGRYTYPSGWNHAAFPFKSESTGDFYVIAGDEAFPNGLHVRDKPTIPAGWIHFIKFDGGWDNPEEVARYEIPEAGTHNFWVDGDTLYVAYYNAGLRVVDISGELMGNLYDQGREIAKYVPMHHEGVVPNAAMTWGPQPYKGHIFISDWNTGIWSLKLREGN